VCLTTGHESALLTMYCSKLLQKVFYLREILQT